MLIISTLLLVCWYFLCFVLSSPSFLLFFSSSFQTVRCVSSLYRSADHYERLNDEWMVESAESEENQILSASQAIVHSISNETLKLRQTQQYSAQKMIDTFAKQVLLIKSLDKSSERDTYKLLFHSVSCDFLQILCESIIALRLSPFLYFSL